VRWENSDIPIEPTKHYVVFTDARIAPGRTFYTRDEEESNLLDCPAGYVMDGDKCHPTIGSDLAATDTAPQRWPHVMTGHANPNPCGGIESERRESRPSFRWIMGNERELAQVDSLWLMTTLALR
jgi:hypothetical protein